MHTLRSAAIATVFAALVVQPSLRADTSAFASALGGGLYSVDLNTAVATLIGNTGVDLMEGLALSSGGTLYGTDVGGNLYSINTTTGASTLIGSTGLGDVEGLGFDGSTLLGTNFANPTTIYSINTTTAAATSVVSASTGVVRGMALDGNEAFVTSDHPVFQSLETINLTTGAVNDIGAIADTNLIAALAYDGTLYGLDSAGNEYTINPSNADLTKVGNAGGQFFLDATLAPVSAVPEPTSILLLVTVLAGAGFALHRKQQA